MQYPLRFMMHGSHCLRVPTEIFLNYKRKLRKDNKTQSRKHTKV